nr:hypothetical protein [Tanacetum cinerariifolium]
MSRYYPSKDKENITGRRSKVRDLDNGEKFKTSTLGEIVSLEKSNKNVIVQTDEPNLSGTTTVEVPKELPKVSMKDTLSSNANAPTFAELFEINDLKAQAQAKDTMILKLKEKLNSLNGDVKDRDVIRNVEESETVNIELGHQEKVLVITALKEQLDKLKGNATTFHKLESNKPVISSTGVNLASSASGSMSQDNTKNNRIRQTQKRAKKNKVEDHLRTVKSSLNKASVVDSKATSSD